jgi:putative ABC transport system permease protein
MSLIEILRAIFINVSTNKFKVFLTSLGIIVGSLTIILVVGIGKGSEASVAEQFRGLNVGTLSIMPAMRQEGPSSANLNLDEALVEAIKAAPSIKGATIMINGRADVRYKSISYSSTVVGATEDFAVINNIALEKGVNITAEDNKNRNRVAIIGQDLAITLFDTDSANAVGKEIIVKGKRYTVIGLLKRSGEAMQGFNPDEGLIIPYQVAEKYIVGRNSHPRVTALAKDINGVATATADINAVLEQKFKDHSTDFAVRDAGARLIAAQDSAKTLGTLLIAIATIVLFVGGIGIMNVLFVSVTERTKEIGILKAIGARKSDILLQFLLEAILISASGGLIGILLGFLVMPMMQYLQLRVIATTYGNVLSFVFSIATGTIFGYYPALKAASLRPIEALNHE